MARTQSTLAALDAHLRGKSIIAVGESTHGTRELFLAQSMLFRHAVEHHAAQVLAMEIPVHTGEALNRWVHGEDVELRPLLQGVWYWLDCEAIADLLRWMRARHSKAHPLYVVGIDPQGARGSAKILLATSPEDALTPVWRTVADQKLEAIADLDGAVKSAWRAVEAASTPLRRRALRAVAQALDVARWCRNDGCRAVKRDVFLAANALGALEELGGPVFVWAHTGHVSHRRHQDGWAPMGWHLRQNLGDALLTVGLDVIEGEVLAPAGGEGALRPRIIAHLNDFTVATYRLEGVDPRTLGATLANSAGITLVTATHPAIQDARLHAYGAFPPGPDRHLATDKAAQSFDLLGVVSPASAIRQP
ncbi:MAG: erythromycin esterase family protein [Bradymonadia bacterium]